MNCVIPWGGVGVWGGGRTGSFVEEGKAQAKQEKSNQACRPDFSSYSRSYYLADKYWVGQKLCMFSFFRKTKDTFFIFTNDFINLDILSMLTISCNWLLLMGRG